MQVQASMVEMSPDEARRILDRHNKKNRPFKARAQERLEQSVEEHGFAPIFPIVFEGRMGRSNLLDGQHRLAWLAKQDSPVLMLVVEFAPSWSFLIADTQSVRDLSDTLRIIDPKMKYVATVAALIRARRTWETEGPEGLKTSRTSRVSNGLGERMYLGWPEVEHFAFLGSTIRGSKGLAQAASGFAMWLISERDGLGSAREFMNAWLSPANREEDSPLSALDAKFKAIRERPSTGSRKATTYEQVGLILKAYDYWRTGRKIGTLTFQIVERFPWAVDDLVLKKVA